MAPTASIIALRPALPARWWLGGLGLALWPHAQWMATRWADGSDDPLGLLALGALGLALWRTRADWRMTPHRGWMMAALALLVLAAVAWTLRAPPLISALLGALSLGAGVGAVRSPRQAALPLLGLALLGLPVIASMQFYAGFPLRVITAQASAALLRLGGWTVEVSGTALTVAGQLVMVDAPCSGVQMVWLAYFSACVAAVWRAVPDACFARRLAPVGAMVMIGNVVRNSVLVALEVASPVWAERLHQPVGLVVLAAVCTLVWNWMGRQTNRVTNHFKPDTSGLLTHPTAVLVASVLGACALWPLLDTAVGAMASDAESSISDPQSAITVAGLQEWPTTWEGRPLRPLATSVVERRFADQFPGQWARLTNGQQVLMWRAVTRPTRMLHPAADCYRALGYHVEQARLERDAQARLWRCFHATPTRNLPDGRPLRVCERIEDAAGGSFTDTSAWYWAAALGQSAGPWQAYTVASPL